MLLVTFSTCTLVNLLTAHLNRTLTFCGGKQQVLWKSNLFKPIFKHSSGYNDETFGNTWKVFSSNKPVELISLDNKKVCFRDAMFSSLARQRRGLYYNTPLVAFTYSSLNIYHFVQVDGCSGSGLFRAFNRHVLHRLKVKQEGPLLDTFRVTLLERKTRFRQILNLNEVCSENLLMHKNQ